jgi:hypothetical protein
MTAPRANAPPGRIIFLLHASQVIGVVLLAVVGRVVLRAQYVASPPLPDVVLNAVLAASLAAIALAFVVRTRVPKRVSDESADLFWKRATSMAIVTWGILEVAGMLAIFAYVRAGSQTGAALTAAAVLAMLLLNPAYLGKR